MAAMAVLSLASCTGMSGFVKQPTPTTTTIDLRSNAVPANQYYDLTKGLRVEVTSGLFDSQILDYSALNTKMQMSLSRNTVIVDPTIKTFVNNSLTSYIRSMGISVGRDVQNDCILQVNVNQFKYIYENAGGRGVVELEYQLLTPNHEVILHQTARGREVVSNGAYKTVSTILDAAYGKALADIDWQGITNNLKIKKRAEQEQQKRVKGDGDTALEHTIIMWKVVSAPQGADVYWRIVSSTPDVKNTNSTYLGTTPYEATESFNVRGLNFENSGNVQVEITCEKPGYLTQSRRFNLRQAIEQREISTKFNLIKDE